MLNKDIAGKTISGVSGIDEVNAKTAKQEQETKKGTQAQAKLTTAAKQPVLSKFRNSLSFLK